MASGWGAAFAALIAWLRELVGRLAPAAIGAYIQHLRQELARARVNAAIERAGREEAQRNLAELDAYRADPDGTDKWLRERAAQNDPNKL